MCSENVEKRASSVVMETLGNLLGHKGFSDFFEVFHERRRMWQGVRGGNRWIGMLRLLDLEQEAVHGCKIKDRTLCANSLQGCPECVIDEIV